MNTCKTCAYWVMPKPGTEDEYQNRGIYRPIDPDTHELMQRGFESRVCKMPTQAMFEAPVADDSFALNDGSRYYAVLVTAENFGCVKHKKVKL